MSLTGTYTNKMDMKSSKISISDLHVFYILCFIVLTGSEVFTEEYCPGESFTPKCRENEVITMQSAVYGRMKMGRCMEFDIGYCSTNVLFWMDNKCSGKSMCEVRIPDVDLNEHVSCSKELTPYLEAEYKCIPVIKSHSGCTIPVSSHKSSLLSTTPGESEGCGLPESPWLLQAKPGQNINITIMDFSWSDNTQTNRLGNRHRSCKVRYGYLVDSDTTEIVDMCGGGGQRVKYIHLSSSNMVQVVIQGDDIEDYVFLIQFTATGCPDIIPPKNSWMTKEEAKVTIGCHGSSAKWSLTCYGNRWQGKFGTCPDDEYLVERRSSETKPGLSNVISLTLIGGLTAVICCVAVTCIIVCFCYRKYKLESKPETTNDYYTTTSIQHKRPPIPLPNGTLVSYRSFRPVSQATMNRQTLGSQKNNNPNSNNMETLTGQIITTQDIPESNLLSEVIYDDPVNLIDDSVQYVNTGSIVNSLQYTKLQKEN